MEYRDFLLILAGGIIGLFTNLIIEIYRRRADNNDAYIAIRAEIESNIDSAEKAVMNVYLWSDHVYKANLNKLKRFKTKIKDVVIFYYKIENYKYRYLLYIEIIDKIKLLNSKLYEASNKNLLFEISEEGKALITELSSLNGQANVENLVILELANEIVNIGKKILVK